MVDLVKACTPLEEALRENVSTKTLDGNTERSGISPTVVPGGIGSEAIRSSHHSNMTVCPQGGTDQDFIHPGPAQPDDLLAFSS